MEFKVLEGRELDGIAVDIKGVDISVLESNPMVFNSSQLRLPIMQIESINILEDYIEIVVSEEIKELEELSPFIRVLEEQIIDGVRCVTKCELLAVYIPDEYKYRS